MRHILLTWNPGPHNDEQWFPEQWEIEMVDGTSEGRTYDGRWSVGNRVQGIEPGDRAYLLRQDTYGRGLVAIGDITSEPFTDDSWRNDGGTAQYVYVTWLEAVLLEQRVDIHDLMAAIPAFKWDNIYSSGRDITEHGAALEGLWFGQVTEAAPLPPVVQGSGFGTAEQNRKVEKAAVQHVTDAYEVEGYRVTSVEAVRCGWDLTAARGNQEIHLEVKGVASSLVRFFLTANEHKAALEDANWPRSFSRTLITGSLGLWRRWARRAGSGCGDWAGRGAGLSWVLGRGRSGGGPVRCATAGAGRRVWRTRRPARSARASARRCGRTAVAARG